MDGPNITHLPAKHSIASQWAFSLMSQQANQTVAAGEAWRFQLKHGPYLRHPEHGGGWEARGPPRIFPLTLSPLSHSTVTNHHVLQRMHAERHLHSKVRICSRGTLPKLLFFKESILLACFTHIEVLGKCSQMLVCIVCD